MTLVSAFYYHLGYPRVFKPQKRRMEHSSSLYDIHMVVE